MHRIEPHFALAHGRAEGRGPAYRRRHHLRHPRRFAPARRAGRVRQHKTISYRFLRWSRLGVFHWIVAAVAAERTASRRIHTLRLTRPHLHLRPRARRNRRLWLDQRVLSLRRDEVPTHGHAERAEIDRRLENAEVGPAMALRPGLAESNRRNVAKLAIALNAPELEASETRRAPRNLIELIVAKPETEGQGLDLVAPGRLAQILTVANNRPELNHGGRMFDVVGSGDTARNNKGARRRPSYVRGGCGDRI